MAIFTADLRHRRVDFQMPPVTATWQVWAPSLLVTASFLPVQYVLVYALVYQHVPEPFISAPISFAVLGSYVLGGLMVLVINYRRLKDINERRRVRVLVVGSVVGWVAAGTFLAFRVSGGARVTAAFFSTPLSFMVLMLFLAFPSSFAYAILRHRVFDLGVIIRRGLQ